ncbi:MAG: hypothetical protein JXB49_21510 [Bacteroidales bacterium]|nr:hypothetical protein [Bacteroidales bacterium]
MKKTIYIFGILTCLLIAAGIGLKVNHMAGAGIILTVSISFFILVFLPLALINNYKNLENKPGKGFYFLTYVTCFILYGATLFKIMHWPGASVILTIAISFPFVVFLPVFLYHSRKEEYLSINQSIAVIFLMAYISVMSAILALNVSKRMIDDTIIVQNGIERDNNLFLMQIDNTTKKINSLSDEDLQKQSQLITSEGDKLYYLIDEIKWEIARVANFENEFYSKNRLDLWEVIAKDNRDMASQVMYGDKQYAEKLKKAFNNYREMALNILPDKEEALRFMIENSFSTSTIQFKGDDIPWDIFYFRGLQVVWVESNLTQFQSNVLLVESELLNYIYLAELKK